MNTFSEALEGVGASRPGGGQSFTGSSRVMCESPAPAGPPGPPTRGAHGLQGRAEADAVTLAGRRVQQEAG